jgi:hypothetical protein
MLRAVYKIRIVHKSIKIILMIIKIISKNLKTLKINYAINNNNKTL